MKKKVHAFIFISIAALAIAPVANLYSTISSKKELPEKWGDWKSMAYNMDFALSYTGRALHAIGISISPEKVVLGKNGWMFLGDSFEKTLTIKRDGIRVRDISTIGKIDENSKEWRKWYSSHGVSSYYVLVGPDKSTIYPENLPNWAVFSKDSIPQEFTRRSPEIFVYPRKELLEMKASTDVPLYYMTDTHWNVLGAWISFDALAKRLALDHPEITTPASPDPKAVKSRPRIGGDLSTFQRIRPYVKDTELELADSSIRKMPVSQFDFKSMKLVYSGDNIQVNAPEKPLLVRSERALNHKRVLWLRDSFGSAMSPFMAATFTETLQLHHQWSNPKVIAELVEAYKPDLVIVTIVERNTRVGILVSSPPAAM
ncbi:hypothetical protein D3C81_295510 [compost metagenome]